uniref:SigE family RNA polymerase sigma factor n=1 Tax=Paractinoplanes polyasparticus TaxID=2856853 RepID=UPI001C85D7A6|nr:SigE family RNA polymerase sigma factor [Actinoplanes polyasparticus]
MTDTVTASRPAEQQSTRTTRDREFTAFVESAATRLRRSAYLMCRDWHLAQDLTQQTFTKMYVVWNRIRTGTNLDAYSRRVLMNLVFDQQKRRSGSEIVLAEMPDQPDGADGGGAPDLHLTLVDALAQLTVDDRAVLVLRHAEDHSVDTVASILGISVSAAKMRDTRALSRLRSLLGDDFLNH